MMTEYECAIIRGYVRDAGGGIVTVVVARDTESYPLIGADVTMFCEWKPARSHE